LSPVENRTTPREAAIARAKSRKPLAPPNVDADQFRPVADLIFGGKAPDWLAGHLQRWSSSLFFARGFELGIGRAEVVAGLDSISSAARNFQSALFDFLDSPLYGEFLENDEIGPATHWEVTATILKDLTERIERAKASSALANSAGRARSGRGIPRPPGACSSEVRCALIIQETWRFLRGAFPAPRSEAAAEAAHLFWRLSGGVTPGWGADPHRRWRHHFKKASAIDLSKLRAEIRRHLETSRRIANRTERGESPT
jgi:hypothetical protein